MRRAVIVLAISAVFIIMSVRAETAWSESPYTSDDVPHLVSAFEHVMETVSAEALKATPKPTLTPIEQAAKDAFNRIDPERMAEVEAKLKGIKDSLPSSGLPEYADGITADELLARYCQRMEWMGHSYPEYCFPEKEYHSKTVILPLDDWRATISTESKQVLSATWTSSDATEHTAERIAAFIYSFRWSADFYDEYTELGYGFIDVFESEFSEICHASEKKPFAWALDGHYQIWTSNMDPLTIQVQLKKNW